MDINSIAVGRNELEPDVLGEHLTKPAVEGFFSECSGDGFSLTSPRRVFHLIFEARHKSESRLTHRRFG